MDNIQTSDYTYHDDNGFYVDSVEKMKARLLTFNEVKELGCEHLKSGSCPEYLYDNLGTNTSGYWTSSTISKNYNQSAWAVYKDDGLVQPGISVSTYYGIRLVIEVEK